MRYVITHGHIFKNAGSTFDSALKKAFGKDFYDHRDDKSMRQGGTEYLDQFILDNPNLKAISSHHLCSPLPVSDQYKCIPIYFLRNPIERVVSVYNFEHKQNGESLGSQMAKGMSLLEYVAWRMTPDAPRVIRNFQTAYLGGALKLHPSKEIDKNHYEVALQKIHDDGVLVGVVEDFPTSFEYMASRLAAYFPGVDFQYAERNVSDDDSYEVKQKRADQLLAPLLDELREKNQFDLLLHEAATQSLAVHKSTYAET